MKIEIEEKWLPIYEALASNVRLKIINLLSEKSMNVKELAENLELSSAIVTMHINKLEKAGIVRSKRTRSKGGIQKLCSIAVDSIEIKFPLNKATERKFHEFDLPIGLFTDYSVAPTCGISTTKKVIGYFDDPRYFLDPERVNAGILWLGQGFVEYKISNFLLASETPEELEISMEISSEAPGYNKNWPSDISFFINGIKLGMWTSPGDFGGKRGTFTPEWWGENINQYGVLKQLRITNDGTFIDGKKISNVTLNDIDIKRKQITFRIAVLEDAAHVGGLTIFGKGFGNYNQDLVFKLYYS